MGRKHRANAENAFELQELTDNNLVIVRLISIAFLIAILSTAIAATIFGELVKSELSIIAFSGAALIFSSISAKDERAITIASNALVLTLTFSIFALCYMGDGIMSAPIVAVPFIPLLCAKLLKPRSNIIYCAVIFIGLIFLLFVTPTGWSHPCFHEYMHAAWLCMVTISTLGISMYVVTRNRGLSKTLRYQGERDFLTGLPNRFKIYQYLFQEIARTAETDECTALMMIDVDNFKAYNDRNGHAAGDTALVNVANRLHKIATKNQGFVGRYGGEEFIFSVTRHSLPCIEKIAEDLRQCVAEMKVETSPGLSESLTITIGVATNFQRPSASYETLIREADQALYKGKNLGRNRVVLSQTNMIHEQSADEDVKSKMAPRKKQSRLRALNSEN